MPKSQHNPEVIARRRKVFQLAKAGISPKLISQKLGVPLRTIYKDLEKLREQLAEELKQYNWSSEIMDMWYRTNNVILKLEALLNETKNVEQRRKILRTIAELTVWQFKTLQYLGILEKEPTISLTQYNQTIQVANITQILDEVMEEYRKWKKKRLSQSPSQ